MGSVPEFWLVFKTICPNITVYSKFGTLDLALGPQPDFAAKIYELMYYQISEKNTQPHTHPHTHAHTHTHAL